jgi:RimJ/RimL family protein N-acetyltransferase
MNSDPRVMTYLGGQPETAEQTKAWIANCVRRWTNQGHGWWALRNRETGLVIGAAAIQQLEENPDYPLEIGWRLHPDAWGQGFATEAGHAMIETGFDRLGASQLCAVTEPDNLASRKVMERLGMHYEDIRTFYGVSLAYYLLDRPQKG